MNGVLQQAKPGPAANPALDTIARNAEAQVPEKLRHQFLTVMTVGGKLMWSEQMSQERAEFDELIRQSGVDVPQVVVHTVLKILSIIQQESRRKEPLEAVGLAAPIFMAHILQYVESRHGIPVTKEMIDETGTMLQVNVLRMYQVSEEQIQELFRQQSQGSMSSAPQSGTEGATVGEPGPVA